MDSNKRIQNIQEISIVILYEIGSAITDTDTFIDKVKEESLSYFLPPIFSLLLLP